MHYLGLEGGRGCLSTTYLCTMAEADVGGESNSKSFSMRMTIYGISKKYPAVRNVTCDQLEKWRQNTRDKLIILVRSRQPLVVWTHSFLGEFFYLRTQGQRRSTT